MNGTYVDLLFVILGIILFVLGIILNCTCLFIAGFIELFIVFYIYMYIIEKKKDDLGDSESELV